MFLSDPGQAEKLEANSRESTLQQMRVAEALLGNVKQDRQQTNGSQRAIVRVGGLHGPRHNAMLHCTT